MSARHLERVVWSPNRTRPPNLAAWPFTIPAVAQLVRDGGFEVPPGVTFLGHIGGRDAANVVYEREDSPLQFHLRAQTNRLASPAGFFLRAEAMHEFLGNEDRVAPAKAWGNEALVQHWRQFLGQPESYLRHLFG